MGVKRNRSGKQEPKGIAKISMEAKQALKAVISSTNDVNDDFFDEKLEESDSSEYEESKQQDRAQKISKLAPSFSRSGVVSQPCPNSSRSSSSMVTENSGIDDPDLRMDSGSDPEVATEPEDKTFGRINKIYCCCGQQAKCKDLQNILYGLSKIDPLAFEHRVGFLRLPVDSVSRAQQDDNAEDADIQVTESQHNRSDRRKLMIKYLKTSNYDSKVLAKCRIAWHHFHPAITKKINFQTSDGRANFPYFAEKKLGYAIGYRNQDVRVYGNDENRYYHTIPKYSLRDVEKEIARFYFLNNHIPVSPKIPKYNLTKEEKNFAYRFFENPELASVAYLNRINELEQKLISAEEAAAKAIEVTGFQGLSRSNFISDAWHAENPKAAKFFTGFHSFHELKLYCRSFFPVELDNGNEIDRIINTNRVSGNASNFEKLFISFIRTQRALELEMISSIYRISVPSLTRFLKIWLPKIGSVGEALSILDINADLLTSTFVPSYDADGLRKVCALVDGKDVMIEVFRKHSFLTRACFSDKVHHAAVRIISWSLPWGLYVEHTDPFLGRSTESSLVHLWGENYWSFRLGNNLVLRKMLPTLPEENEENDDEDKEFDEIVANIHAVSGVVPNATSSSTVLLNPDPTNSDSDDDNETYENVDQDDSSSVSEDDDRILNDVHNDDETAEKLASSEDFQEDSFLHRSADHSTSITSKDIIKDMNKYISDCKARAASEPTPTDGRRKRAQALFTAENLNAANIKASQGGPDFNKERKVEQLKLHETLHNLFESRQLKPNMLSYYLSKTVDYRNNMLKFLANPQDETLPVGFVNSITSTRLAKFPPGWIILADRGFASNCYMYPNLNHHITPHFLSGRAQFEREEISKDREICQRRYTCEVAFARFTDIKALRDVVPFQFNDNLPSIVHWGHAYNNLQQPLKKPHDYDSYIERLSN